MTPPPMVEATGLVRRYGRGRHAVVALAGVDLTVAAGEIVGLSGPSGSGKSTLLRLLATVERPSAGTLRLGGEPVRGPRSDGFVAPVFQDAVSSLDPRWPLWRIVTEPLLARHRRPTPSRARRRALAAEWLGEVGMGSVDLDARSQELSGGQSQRLALVRALVGQPRLLVADEPTSALDVSVAAGVLHLLARVAASGVAVVVASHHRAALDALGGRLLTITNGVLAR